MAGEAKALPLDVVDEKLWRNRPEWYDWTPLSFAREQRLWATLDAERAESERRLGMAASAAGDAIRCGQERDAERARADKAEALAAANHVRAEDEAADNDRLRSITASTADAGYRAADRAEAAEARVKVLEERLLDALGYLLEWRRVVQHPDYIEGPGIDTDNCVARINRTLEAK